MLSCCLDWFGSTQQVSKSNQVVENNDCSSCPSLQTVCRCESESRWMSVCPCLAPRSTCLLQLLMMNGWWVEGWIRDGLGMDRVVMNSRRASSLSSVPPASVSACFFSPVVPGLGPSPSDQLTLCAGSLLQVNPTASLFSGRCIQTTFFSGWFVVLSRGRLTKYKV